MSSEWIDHDREQKAAQKAAKKQALDGFIVDDEKTKAKKSKKKRESMDEHLSAAV